MRGTSSQGRLLRLHETVTLRVEPPSRMSRRTSVKDVSFSVAKEHPFPLQNSSAMAIARVLDAILFLSCSKAKRRKQNKKRKNKAKKKRLMTIFMRRYLWLDPTEMADSRRILA